MSKSVRAWVPSIRVAHGWSAMLVNFIAYLKSDAQWCNTEVIHVLPPVRVILGNCVILTCCTCWYVVAIRRQVFWTYSNDAAALLAGPSKTWHPYSRIGLIRLSYNHIYIARSAQHWRPATHFGRGTRFRARVRTYWTWWFIFSRVSRQTHKNFTQLL